MARNQDQERYLTDREVAERWQASRSHVRRLRYSGTLATARFGRVVRIPLSSVLAYEEAMTS